MKPAHAALLSLATACFAAMWAGVTSLLVRLAAPEAMAWLVLPWLTVVFYLIYLVWRARAIAALGDAGTLAKLSAAYSPRRRTARVLLLGLAGTLLVTAMARPQWGERPREVRRTGIDVVFAVDISRSMLATDVAPSRLSAQIAEVDRILRRLEGDRVGLVVFAGISFVQSPITSDYGAIRLYLDRLDPDDMPVQGTAIGRAIQEATTLLTGGGDPDHSRADHQVIVVFSDGEDHDGDPVSAAEEARANGIDVYTVGVGTEEGGQIPVRGPDGTVVRYFEDRNGQLVITSLEEEQLVAIAAAGGGEYVALQSGGSAARVIEEVIEGYEAETLTTVLRTEYQDRFMFFLFPALFLFIAAFVTPPRRPGPEWVAVAFALLPLTGCGDTLLRPDPRVEEAIALAEAGEGSGADEALERAGAEATEQAEFDYVSAYVSEQAGRWADAQVDYLRSLNMEGEPKQIAATFALGNALLAREAYADAIARFERVLTLDPSHAGAGRNLEIALLRLYPPCTVSLDDEFEELSDEAATAPVLPAPVYEGEYLPPGVEQTQGQSEEAPPLVVCGGDRDVYAIPVLGGATVSASVAFTRLREDTGGPTLPARIAPTDVRITLYDIDGVTPLAVDQGLAELDDTGTVGAISLSRNVEDVLINPGYEQGSTVYLSIEVNEPLEYETEVSITLVPPCYALEDEFESNDTQATARALDSGEYEARLCESNDDWFRVDLQPVDDLFLDVTPPANDDGTFGAVDVRFGAAPLDEQTAIEAFETGQQASYALRAPQQAESAMLALASRDGVEGGYGVDVYRYAPCPVGRDRFEPNDESQQRTALDVAEAPFRFLRLCPADVDWFELTLPEPTDEEQEESDVRRFSAVAELLPPGADPEPKPIEQDGAAEPVQSAQNPPQNPAATTAPVSGDPATTTAPRPDPQVQLVLYDAVSGQQLAGSRPVQFSSAAAREGVTGERGSIAYVELPWDVQRVAVGVTGDPTYYHLSFPQTSPSNGESGEQGEEGEDGEEGEESDSEEQNADQADEEEEEEEQTPEEQEQAEEEEQEEQEQEDAEAARADEEEDEREALRQLLDSLEPLDNNLPLEQALENAPPMRMQNEW